MPAPAKADANQIKSFIYAQRWGVLATHSHTQQGFPFGSVVPYDLDERGDIVIYISLIAEHYKNLKDSPRASLTVLDSFGVHDPQAYARACLLLNFSPVGGIEAQAVQKSYEQRFPQSFNYEIAHNFLFMRGTIERIRWIGGFGDIQWIGKEQYAAATPDPLAYASWDAIQHMNEDHQDALRDMVAAQRSGSKPKGGVTMVGLGRENFTVRVSESGNTEDVVIPFVRVVEKPEDLRAVMVETLRAARND